MKRNELIDRISDAVSGIYEATEAKAIAFAVAENLYGIGRTGVVADPDAIIPQYEESVIAAVCERLAAGEPLQYVLGGTEFCGLDISVAKGVLIPRPETEELIAWICRDHGEPGWTGVPEDRGRRQGSSETTDPAMRSGSKVHGSGRLKILDIGTGSGAIAVSLAKYLPKARVVALDVSDDALTIAAANARRNGVEVAFVQADILAPAENVAEKLFRAHGGCDQKLCCENSRRDQNDARASAAACGYYDIVVSNPPYIPLGERDSMHVNVKEYEPAGALFVSDGDPLVFYREIGLKALAWLRRGGALYVEVHEDFAAKVCEMLRSQGFSEIECRTDINDKPRMIKCLKV